MQKRYPLPGTFRIALSMPPLRSTARNALTARCNELSVTVTLRPDRIQQFILGNDPAVVVNEIDQQIEYARLQ